jgi:carbamoyl-phosphate synthase large subunit
MLERNSFPILFTSAGRRVELLRLFASAASEQNLRPYIIAADSDIKWSAACRFADIAIQTPPSASPEFCASIEKIMDEFGVRLTIPAADHDLLAIASVRDRRSGRGGWYNLSSTEVVRVCRDKLMTARKLDAAGIPVPITEAAETSDRLTGCPVVLKPRGGSSSQGIRHVRSWNPSACADLPDHTYIVQEYVEGKEYTTTLYVDASGQFLDHAVHMRLRTRGGEVEKAVLVDEPEFLDLARQIVDALPGLYGILCFQCIRSERNGIVYVIEINARIGGGFPLAHHAGFRFANWLIEEARGCKPTIQNYMPKRSRFGMVRYDQSVFFDVN